MIHTGDWVLFKHKLRATSMTVAELDALQEDLEAMSWAAAADAALCLFRAACIWRFGSLEEAWRNLASRFPGRGDTLNINRPPRHGNPIYTTPAQPQT